MKWSVVGLVALGLVAAFSAAFLVTMLGNEAKAARGVDEATEVTLMVAKRDMPAVTIVKAEDVQEMTLPAKDAPKGHVSSTVQAIGKVLAGPMVAGQPFTTTSFVADNRGMALVAMLTTGKRAVTVELTDSAGLEGLLYPGAVVDVLASFKLNERTGGGGNAVSTTLLRSVEVLAIDDKTINADQNDSKESEKDDAPISARRKTRRVTLLVDTKQAEALQLATEHGTVSLAMRNPQDDRETDEDATLLSEGRLASLAQFLSSTVRADQPVVSDEGGAPADAPPVAAASPLAGNEPKTREWNVTVYRGLKTETQTFTLNRD